jgi:hypothetical protein
MYRHWLSGRLILGVWIAMPLAFAQITPEGETAAARYQWGAPLPISDEFDDYSGRPDPAKWSDPTNWGPDGCGAGHAGNGRRCAKNSVVANGILVMTGAADGDTGWLKQKLDRQYGRWEARVRSYNVGSSGREYHPLLLIWPESEQRVQDGEYDWLENSTVGSACAEAFLHYPGETPRVQEHAEETGCGASLSDWHNVAFEWTAVALKGYINGVEWFSFGEADIAAMPSGHLNIQLDNFKSTREAKFEVDWVRTYDVP